MLRRRAPPTVLSAPICSGGHADTHNWRCGQTHVPHAGSACTSSRRLCSCQGLLQKLPNTRCLCQQGQLAAGSSRGGGHNPLWRRERIGGGLAHPLSNVLPAMATPAFTPHGSGYSTPTGTTGGMNTPLLVGRVLASRRVVIERHFGGRRYRGLHWCAGVAAGQRFGGFIARGERPGLCRGMASLLLLRPWCGLALPRPWCGPALPPAVCSHACLLMPTALLCNSLCLCAVLGAAGTTCRTCSTRSSTALGEQRVAHAPVQHLRANRPVPLLPCRAAAAAHLPQAVRCRQCWHCARACCRYRFYLVFVVAYVTMVSSGAHSCTS